MDLALERQAGLQQISDAKLKRWHVRNPKNQADRLANGQGAKLLMN
jgi:hypothetical protein